jgi:hypothetical protein
VKSSLSGVLLLVVACGGLVSCENGDDPGSAKSEVGNTTPKSDQDRPNSNRADASTGAEDTSDDDASEQADSGEPGGDEDDTEVDPSEGVGGESTVDAPGGESTLPDSPGEGGATGVSPPTEDDVFPLSGCDDAEVPVPSMSDADCDVHTPAFCPAGSHIDFSVDSPCAVCVSDTPENRTCEWAERCFEPFLEHVAATSGAKACEEDEDCRGSSERVSCAPVVTLALRGLLNEEISEIAKLYDEQNCTSCGVAGESVTSLLDVDVECVQGICQLAEPDAATQDAGSPAQETCWFEFLGDWVRCEESWSGAGGLPPDGELLAECADQCLDDPTCTTVYDYTYLGVGLPCHVYSGECTAGPGVGHEEDAAREYKKVCGSEPPADAIFSFPDASGVRTSPESQCRFEYLGSYDQCEGEADWADAEVTGETFSECLSLCEANPDCSAIVDWWLDGPSGFECILHLASCSELESRDDYGGRTFKKVCD